MFARRQAGSRELGNDVFGEAMRRVVARLDRLDRIESGYVFAAIRNVALELRKKARRRRDHCTRATSEAEVHHPHPERPDQYAARAETRERVRRAMRQLPEEHRDVIELTELKDQTQAETASELDMSERKVRDVRKAGLAMLRRLLRGGRKGPVGDD